jgi:polyphosphate kinase
MQRNFDRRVEAVTPVESRELHPRLHALLGTYLEDHRQAWELSADGTYRQRQPAGSDQGSHAVLAHDPWGLTRPLPPSGATKHERSLQAD